MGAKAIALSALQGAEEPTVVQVFVELLSQLDLEKDVRQVLNINVPALPRGKDPGGPVGASGLGHVAGPLR